MKSYSRLALVVFVSICMALPAWGAPCSPADRTLQRPNLVASAPERVRVLERSGVRQLQFTTRIANLGAGPLQIRSTLSGGIGRMTQIVTRADGSTCEIFLGAFSQDSSDRFSRLPDYAHYFVRADNPLTGRVVASGVLNSYCITDVAPARGPDTPRQVDSTCTGPDSSEGLSVGWSDAYDNLFAEQSIALDSTGVGSIPGGTYYLVIVPDPANRLLESDEGSAAEYGVAAVTVPQRISAATLPSGPTPMPAPTFSSTAGPSQSTPTPSTPSPSTPSQSTPTAVRPTASVPRPTATATARRPTHPTRPQRPSRPARPTHMPRPPRPGSATATPTAVIFRPTATATRPTATRPPATATPTSTSSPAGNPTATPTLTSPPASPSGSPPATPLTTTPTRTSPPTATPTRTAPPAATPTASYWGCDPSLNSTLLTTRMWRMYYAYPGTTRALIVNASINLGRSGAPLDPTREPVALALLDHRKGLMLEMRDLRFVDTGNGNYSASTPQGFVTLQPITGGYNFNFQFDDPTDEMIIPRDLMSGSQTLCFAVGNRRVYEPFVCQVKPNNGFLCHDNN